MKKLSNTEAELKKSVAYIKSVYCYSNVGRYLAHAERDTWCERVKFSVKIKKKKAFVEIT